MTSRTLSEIAELCGAELIGDGTRIVHGPASLAEASSDHVSFLAEPRYREQLLGTQAAGVLVEADFESTRDDLTLLRCANPSRAFNRIVLAFAQPQPACEPGVHPTAVVAPDVELGEGVHVGPLVVIGPGSVIGAHVVLHASCVIGAGARIGARTVLYPSTVLYPFVEIGEDCILHAGAVLGADGFGFEPTATGWDKTPQAGKVELGDRVEVGSNSTIDRARFGSTRLGDEVKLDNLVHLGHNVQIGAGSLLVAQAGVAGSSNLGKRVIVAGQAGINGHITVGDGAQIAGKSGVFDDVPAGETVFGIPAMEKREGMRMTLAFKRVGRLIERVRSLEARIEELESGP
tara:strand:- start:9817 stop:10854 length:1038 start_codon:yes stop_codon:yes gene_type:complete